MHVANTDSVVRFPYHNGDLAATGKAEQVIGPIPWVHHWTRDIAFTADGKRLLLDVGSGSNIALDMFPEPRVPGELEGWNKTQPLGATWDTEERRANVLSYAPDGTDERVVATGIRNCTGLTIQPTTSRPSPSRLPGWNICGSCSRSTNAIGHPGGPERMVTVSMRVRHHDR